MNPEDAGKGINEAMEGMESRREPADGTHFKGPECPGEKAKMVRQD